LIRSVSNGVSTVHVDDYFEVVDTKNSQIPVVMANAQGVKVTGNTIERVSGTGWGNAGASSTAYCLSGFCAAYVTAESTTGSRMYGLSSADPNQNYTTINYGLYLTGNNVNVYENGTYRGAFGTYGVNDTFSVQIESGVVKYYRLPAGSSSWQLLYSSTVAPSFPLRMDSAIYDAGSKLTNLKMYGSDLRTTASYYKHGASRVAMRTHMSDVSWLHSDHLGSSSLATDNIGAQVVNSDQRYSPFGGTRVAASGMKSKYGFTDQYSFAETTGLLDFNARMYSPLLGRFISADTIVPGAGNPQAFNRYSYVLNNPLGYTDPSGHCPKPTVGGAVICIAAFIPTAYSSAGPKSYIGDNRTFSSNSRPDQNRMWMWVDAKTGEVLRVGFHDTVNETGTVYPWKDNPRKNNSYVDTKKLADGTIQVRYEFYCADPDPTCAAGPKGEMLIKPTKDKSGRVTRFSGSLSARPFPNLEAYYWENGKLVATIFNVENFPESERREGRASDLTGLYGMWLGDPPNTILFSNGNLNTYWYYDSTTDIEDYRAMQRR
jgi:RHS repeat-associated protein